MNEPISMKIIDENGMILGKINIIDLTVFFFVIVLLFTGYKYLYLKNYPQNVLDTVVHPEYEWVNVTVRYVEMSPIIFERATSGDTKYKDVLGENKIPMVRLLDKKLINQTDAGIYAEFLFEIYVEKKSDGFYYEGSKMILGSPFDFDTYIYEMRYGLLWDIEGKHRESE